MARHLLVVACALLVAVLADLITVVEPQARLTKRIMFVVDVSGSMRGDKLGAACAAVTGALQQPVDEMEIAVIAFNDQPRRWPGIPEDGERRVPAGWAALPSQDAVREAEKFLAGLGAEGNTLVVPALQAALAEERKELSLVLVSDGIFQQESEDEVADALEAGQKKREERELGRAVLLVYGVGSEAGVLRRLGTAGRGGYLREPLERLTPVQPGPGAPGGVQGSAR